MDAQKEQAKKEAFYYVKNLKDSGFFSEYDTFEDYRNRHKKTPIKAKEPQLTLEDIKKAEEEYKEGKGIPLEKVVETTENEMVEVPIIGKIVPDEKLGNRVIFEETAEEKKERAKIKSKRKREIKKWAGSLEGKDKDLWKSLG